MSPAPIEVTTSGAAVAADSAPWTATSSPPPGEEADDLAPPVFDRLWVASTTTEPPARTTAPLAMVAERDGVITASAVLAPTDTAPTLIPVAWASAVASELVETTTSPTVATE